MKRYNYFYNGIAISKAQFLSNVPEGWENDVENGEYSHGYYRAIEIWYKLDAKIVVGYCTWPTTDWKKYERRTKSSIQ